MEKVKVTLKPSQWVNFPLLLVAIGFGYLFIITTFGEYGEEHPNIIAFTWVFLIPFVKWIWKTLKIYCWSFYMDEDSEIIIEEKGVFSVTTVQIQYFRIKSVRVSKPFFMRLVGISNVHIATSEPFKPYLVLYAIRDGEQWAMYCKEMAKYKRQSMGIKEMDFHHF